MFLEYPKEESITKFGYPHVSKNDQSLDIQIRKLKDAGREEIFTEKVSEAKDNRTERVKAGLETAYKKGRKGGRPKA